MITCESETTNPLGSLKHYLDPYMHNTQIIILHNVMNQPEDILKTMPLFSSVCKLRGKALSRSQFIAPVDHKYHR